MRCRSPVHRRRRYQLGATGHAHEHGAFGFTEEHGDDRGGIDDARYASIGQLYVCHVNSRARLHVRRPTNRVLLQCDRTIARLLTTLRLHCQQPREVRRHRRTRRACRSSISRTATDPAEMVRARTPPAGYAGQNTADMMSKARPCPCQISPNSIASSFTKTVSERPSAGARMFRT